MTSRRRRPLYRHTDVALLRAAVIPTEPDDAWPDLDDVGACRAWLQATWSRPAFAAAVRQASPSLTERVDAVRTGDETRPRQVRRAVLSTARYVLRATGRPTPFGLFAGVAPAAVGKGTTVCWARDHQVVVRPNTAWLDDVIGRLEGCPDLLERLEVVFTNLAVARGGRLKLPGPQGRITIRVTTAVAAAREAARVPVRFGDLAGKVAAACGDVELSRVHTMLSELVRQGFLLSSLRAPFTTTDQLSYLVDRLREVDAAQIVSAAGLVADLEATSGEIRCLNAVGDDQPALSPESGRRRDGLAAQMARFSPASRGPLAVDMRLGCEVALPAHVASEMERAATALLRLSRRPAGEPTWRAYHAAFVDRYGTGTLVPVREVVDPDTGLGYPAGYPGSRFRAPANIPAERDERLLALAWQATVHGSGEILLTDDLLEGLTAGDSFDPRAVPPHVELAGRIHAIGTDALHRGDYTITVSPARSAGTLTSRFTPIATGAGLEVTYRDLPTATDGALAAQLSFAPLYPHAGNVCRVPDYLDQVVPLGEHRSPDHGLVTLDDLAVTATRDRLHLVSLTRRQIVEPQVFHALALDKHVAPMVRFLAHLIRGFLTGWYQFDWGPHAARLPYLPAVRYRRTVLSPAQWRLTPSDIRPQPGRDSDATTGTDAAQARLERWRRSARCPNVVELRDDDRTLRLTLDEPTHRAILRAHLDRHDEAVLTEAPAQDAFGWIDGHAHEIAFPLRRAGDGLRNPLQGPMPTVTNRDHGDLPGSPDARWLTAKAFVHSERHREVIVNHLPVLAAALDAHDRLWFVRYRSDTEADHLRIRLPASHPAERTAAEPIVGEWARDLKSEGLLGGLTLDTYHPEVGRYGSAPAITAAEDAFAADSRAVIAGLRALPEATAPATALVAAGMAHIAAAFLGGRADAWRWLTEQPAPPRPSRPTANGDDADHAIDLASGDGLSQLPGWSDGLERAWCYRADAVAAYRAQLPDDTDLDAVLESLLHMHHNRAIGIDLDSERRCRRLARNAALGEQARRRAPHDTTDGLGGNHR